MPFLNDIYPDEFLLEKGDDFSTDLFEEGEAVSLEDLLHLVQEASEDGSLDIRKAHFECDEDALVWGLSVLCETRLGRDLAFDARFEDWSIEVDDIEDGAHIINTQLRILILPRCAPSPQTLSRSQSDRCTFLLEFARGLRGIWHDMTDARITADITIDDQILWARLRQADLDMCALRMAWEIRQAGMAGLWRQIIASPLGDMAVVAGEIWGGEEQEDAREAADLMLYGFSHLILEWLKDATLVNGVDAQTLDALDVRLQRSINDVCGPVQLTARDILNLSTIPGEGAYLAPLARTILFAPSFRDVLDPVNEAYLRQILEECELNRSSPLVFSDSELEKKFFPHKLDTIA
ncbi:MAG: hypothetical protein RBR86_07770 [Pseudobdellovibrionaceae bacterium]|jgi:hypothetical protein|nr:hypothetical protein [Pseudobdellovibrionaceae bacterium]